MGLHKPTFRQTAKKYIDNIIFTTIKSISSPIAAAENKIKEAGPLVVNKPPVNATMLPEPFIERFTRPTPCPQQIVYELENARVAWHGSVVKGLRVFVPSLPYPFLEPEFGGLFLLRQFKSHTIPNWDGPVGLIFDNWSIGNYYHWIAEALPRLILLRRVKPDCLILLPGPTPPMYVTRTVKALGFDRTYIMSPGEILNVPRLHVPALPGLYGCIIPEYVKDVRKAILEDVQSEMGIIPVPKRRVYVSRSMQKWRQLTNESELLELLEFYEFEVVYFEKMSFIEQVIIMQETQVFLTIHGANMTNMLFLPDESKAIEILSEDNINPSYLYMANSIGLNYYCIPAILDSAKKMPSNYADMKVDVNLIDEFLLSLLN